MNDPPSPEFLSVETSESNLQKLVSDYRTAIAGLPNRERDCERPALTVLLAREQLAGAIGKDAHKASGLVTEISDLDQDLKSKAGSIISCAGTKTFQNWRDIFQPQESSWWWFL